MAQGMLLEIVQAAVGAAGLVFAVLAWRLVRSNGRVAYALMALAAIFVLAAALAPWRVTPDLSPEIVHLRGALHILRGSASDELARIGQCVDRLADPAATDRQCAVQAKALLVDLGNDLKVVAGQAADVGCLLVKVAEGEAKSCP